MYSINNTNIFGLDQIWIPIVVSFKWRDAVYFYRLSKKYRSKSTYSSQRKLISIRITPTTIFVIVYGELLRFFIPS